MATIRKFINEHFQDFLDETDCTMQLLIGGYGSSKSYHCALKIILMLLREVRTCLVVREVYGTLRESCYALFVEICESLELESAVTFNRSPLMLTFQNGSRIIFRGLDKPQKLKSIVNISVIWIEECSEIRYDAFKELIGRLRHPSLKLYMLLSTNPVARSNWVYKHFFTDKGINDAELYRRRILREGKVYLHHSVADDNQFLPADYIAKLEEMKTYDTDLYRVARLGQFGVNGVKVLPQFGVMNHEEIMSRVADIPERLKFNGLDFGFETSYDALIRVAVDDKEKILYIYDEFYKNHLTILELGAALKKKLDSRDIIRCDSAEPRSIESLRRMGLKAVAAKKWNGGTRHARLDNTRKVKSFKKIFCSTDCKAAIMELAELTYAKDKNDEIIADEFSIDSHCLSAIFYALDSYRIGDLKYELSRKDLFGY